MPQITWDDLIITTIKLEGPNGKSVDDLVDGDKVVFNEMDGNEGTKASFLKDIKQDMNESSWSSYRVFTATYVSPSEAAKIANEGFGSGCTPLFYVHGYNSEPGYTLETIMPRAKQHCLKEKIFFPIPVIWPCYGWYSGYNTDQNKYSLKAGVNLRTLVDDIPNHLFPKKTLLCHSMGNHLVFNGACGKNLPTDPTGEPGDPPDVTFDNIFLVAADVERDIFLENPSQGEFGHKREKAANMKAMLADGGKIYVVHNEDDMALFGSIALNAGRERIGAKGAYEIRPDFRDTVINIDAKPFTDQDEEHDDSKLHSYQFEDWAVDIYCHPEKHIN